MINGNTLKIALISGANNLSNHKTQVDELNVFPVPDGDTGTNMSMTFGNAARELETLTDEGADKVAATCSSALLRGARGNSGVITSLLFRGFASAVKGKAEIDSESLANAFKLGVENAYKAVMRPTEGTILTVSRVASENAAQALKDGKDTTEIFESALAGAKEALAETPELLPALKKAGVVDAGGQGYVYILEGMLSVIKDGKVIASEVSESKAETESESSFNAAGEYETEITFTYCTEYIVNRNPECTLEPSELRSYLESIGDCVVVVDDDEIIKVHVHTDHPGNAIEHAIEFGQLVHLKIENMRDQHERAKHDAKEKKNKPVTNKERTEVIESVTPENEVGFVSVCAGDGLKQLFKDLGVDTIVSGGQTMNPSTDDILRAIEKTPAKTVFVFPNNKNIIMAAEQAIPLSSRNVIVVHTRTVPQGVASLLAFDPDETNEQNALNMRAACDKISTGQITFAARNSDYDGFNITKGELLALLNGKVSFVETDMEKCVLKLAKSMIKRDSSFMTVYYGKDVTDEEAEKINEVLNEKYGNKLEITLIGGGQPVYYYIISVE